MTNQEAFDKMLGHLRSLPEASRDCDGDCVYNGAMCAVGVLMTADEQELYGGHSGDVADLFRDMRRDGFTSELHSLDGDMLYEMQRAHDELDNWSEADGFNALGEDAAREVAYDTGLVYTAPENRIETGVRHD
jgi:hypothetical protein